MNELALFAGAGGGILGGCLLGWRTVAAVEIEPYAREVLLRRQLDGILPKFPIWDDIRTFDGRPWAGHIDIITGGFPCQAWSTAARGRNTAQNLWPEMLRVVGEICPRYVFAENVDEGAIVAAQSDLAIAGFWTMRGMVSAADVGADHPRERWWLVADANHESELGRAIDAKVAMLPESQNSLWQSDPRDPRVAHGVAHRMDRLGAIGNGQVPLVAAIAFLILHERMKTHGLSGISTPYTSHQHAPSDPHRHDPGDL